MNQELLTTPSKKSTYNEIMFTRIAPVYSVISNVISLGRDSAWKRILIDDLPQSNPVSSCLDLACGTGDLTFLLAERYPKAHIKGVDLTAAMLDRARRKNHYSNVELIQQDICDLAQDSESVDIVTGSYAIRNAPDLVVVLKEVNRVLKPGGVAAFLDLSKPTSRLLQVLEYLFLKFWCSFWGLLLHGSPGLYGYIAESLRFFPDRKLLREQFKECGLEVISSRKLYLGVLEIIVIQKATTPAE